MPDELLTARGLGVDFHIDGDWHSVTRNVSFDLRAGETVALVGESGSGKSVTAMSLLGLLPKNTRRHGSAAFGETDLITAGDATLRRIRGREISMVFQEPMSALNPVYTIGAQLCAVLRQTEAVPVHSVHDEALRLLRAVHMPDPEQKLNSYPHQLSGGQRQRAMIAMAISGSPKVLIADEPTTALDVTVQAEILDLLLELQAKSSMAILIITHDMGVVADIATRAIVMEKGEVVEQAEIRSLFSNPVEPYTKRLLAAVPYLGKSAPATRPQVTHPGKALNISALEVTYGGRSRRRAFKAITDLSLSVQRGEVLGLVGESGSGKTTVGKTVMGLVKASGGVIRIDDRDVNYMRRRKRRNALRHVSMVFQDPVSSLNPRLPIWRSITDPLKWKHLERRRGALRQRAVELLRMVDMPEDVADRYPHELSGGQRQRVGIARALAVDPALLIADEPTSALDVSVQATVLALLQKLQQQMGFACLFISHDLAVIEILANRIAVLQNGDIVETGDAQAILSSPASTYTQNLIAAAPVPDPVEQQKRRSHRLAVSAP